MSVVAIITAVMVISNAVVVHVCQAKTGPAAWKWISENAGQPHDEHVVQKAAEEVEEFCRVLQLEGVTVHRPEPMRWDQLGTFRTPYFEDGGWVGWNMQLCVLTLPRERCKVLR